MFHVYDRLHLDRIPCRFTVEPGKRLSGSWASADGGYDLWVLGPNGFHRHFTGSVSASATPAEVGVVYDRNAVSLRFSLRNDGTSPCVFVLVPNAYLDGAPTRHEVAAGADEFVVRALGASRGWYDFTVNVEAEPAYARRFAGRLETGASAITDPAMHGTAIGEQYRRI